MVKSANFYERLGGWTVFVIAFLTFFRTMAPTVSFWDCGQYIAASNILGIVHPPGNPLYILIGRVATVIFFWSEQVAWRTNMVSVITAAFTALFLFKIATFSMKEWICKNGVIEKNSELVTVLVTGFVGALFGVFNYTFWFSAVETSVYVPAILTIVLNVYIVLIWAKRKKAGDKNCDKYLVLFAYFHAQIHRVALGKPAQINHKPVRPFDRVILAVLLP